MDILIKGMGLPVDRPRVVLIYPNGEVKVSVRFDVGFRTVAKAIEVPPHGRLIDADALKKHMTDLLRHDYVFDEVGCFGLVKDAPTLLEANT